MFDKSTLKNKVASLIVITAPQAVIPMPYQAHACAAKAEMPGS